jgi:hypothetical protein
MKPRVIIAMYSMYMTYTTAILSVVLQSSSNPILLEFNDLTKLYATYFHVIMLVYIYISKDFFTNDSKL